MRHFKIELIEKSGGIPLLYVTGGVPHWLFRRIAIFHNISYSNLRAMRISGTDDHWVIVKHGKIEPFEDLALLP
jgi:hypothetical protein